MTGGTPVPAAVEQGFRVSRGEVFPLNMRKEGESMEKDTLAVLWSSGDRDVALKVAFMYTINAKKKGWWKNVRLIIWGPSARLLSVDREVREYAGRMREEGVVLEACVTCADEYGVSDNLRSLGVDVKKMGLPLTEYLKSGTSVLTF